MGSCHGVNLLKKDQGCEVCRFLIIENADFKLACVSVPLQGLTSYSTAVNKCLFAENCSSFTLTVAPNSCFDTYNTEHAESCGTELWDFSLVYWTIAIWFSVIC